MHIEDLIDKIGEPVFRRLLRDRYIKLFTWEQVAEDVLYSVQHTRGALHKQALEAAEAVMPLRES